MERHRGLGGAASAVFDAGWRGEDAAAFAGKLVQRWETAALCSLLPDGEDLSAPITDLEPDGKGITILVKQYLELGGKLPAFSVDPQFGNTLDGSK